MNLYQLLSDNQAPTSFDHGDERAFYNRYSFKLSDNEPFAYLSKVVDSFGVIRYIYKQDGTLYCTYTYDAWGN